MHNLSVVSTVSLSLVGLVGLCVVDSVTGHSDRHPSTQIGLYCFTHLVLQTHLHLFDNKTLHSLEREKEKKAKQLFLVSKRNFWQKQKMVEVWRGKQTLLSIMVG